jgi:hypothetical protein
LKQPINLMLVAMVIAMFIVLAAWPPPNGIEHQQAATQPQKEQAEKPHRNPLIAFWRWTTHDEVAFYTAALFLATGLLGAIAIVQIRFLARADETARKAAEAAKQSADATIALERPFIYIDAKPSALVAKGSATYPADFTINLSFTNLGRVPAVIRMVYAEASVSAGLPAKPAYPVKKIERALSVIASRATPQERRCEKGRASCDSFGLGGHRSEQERGDVTTV